MNNTNARKTVNIALVGGGFMGKEHSKAYALSPVIFPDIAATPVKKIICDVDAAIASKNAEQWGYEEWCTDWRELLERDDIDIIDLCTPPFLHTEMAIEIMKAGKFVFCEKPLTTTLADCEKLVEAVKQYNGRSAVAFNKRRWPAAGYARKLVKDGAIGQPLIYNGRYCLAGGEASAKKYSFRSKWELGGGFADALSHVIDMCSFILDDHYDELVGLTEVFQTEAYEQPADGGAPIAHVRDAEDLSLVIAKMKSGVTTSFYRTSYYNGAGEDLSFEVIGTKGTLRWSGSSPSVLQMYQLNDNPAQNGFKSILMGPLHPYGQAVPPLAGFGVGVDDVMSFQAYEVINAYVNNTKFTPDILDTLEIVQVCDAVRKSNETRAWVKL